MPRIDTKDLSFDEFDEIVSPRPEEHDFDRIVDAALDRRGFLGGVLAFGSVASLGVSLSADGAKAAGSRFAFEQVATSTADGIVVPAGYKTEVLVRWGDPMWSGVPEFDDATRGTAESQARAFGDNTDGMDVFSHDGHTLLVVNNEYTNRDIIALSAVEKRIMDEGDIAKGMMAHGVSVVEIVNEGGAWAMVKDSPFNRRITPMTEMDLTGPAAGHDLLKTDADPTGTKSLGTWNNCGNGVTPWGTYLACEENFNGYFSAPESPDHEVSEELKRYGVSAEDWGYNWALIEERYDVSKHPNEPNRAGYVVEIDPTDPTSTPKKRTALGRFKHENAEAVVNVDGRVVVYMGDDERGEFVYRYVSNGVFAPGAPTDGLLDDGVLYAATFAEDGTGKWVALTPETTGMDNALIHIHTRQAASAVGATTMDRPEWISANPVAPEVYCCLTNNKNRGVKPNAGGDDTSVNGPNPREANNYGQIVRWMPDNEDHASPTFSWDFFALAGNPTVHDDEYGGSENITA
ncbi:MAG: PhoX family phosphatase, partial [Pseudomonadota bacterium]